MTVVLAMLAVLMGVAFRAAVSIVVIRVIATLLFGITVTDPLTISGVGGLTLLVALLACVVPVISSTRVNPAVSLRHD